mmetsp:Transcript_29552/g.47512  ORF Transcript_29552/g.47512 Transcript_29552/m.47512 type:complete len:339 (+) Transcript_29552:120-1136(+)
MALLHYTLLLAGLVLATAQECDVCHLHHSGQSGVTTGKEVSSAEVFDSGATQCREYQSESCCTQTEASAITLAGLFYDNGDGSDTYTNYGCGPVSATCQAFFIDMQCFHKCDKNAGKFRKFENCQADTVQDDGTYFDGEETDRIPVRASHCNAMFEACKDESYCATAPKNSINEIEDCVYNNWDGTGCKTFKEVWNDGTDMCDNFFETSVQYQADDSISYVMKFPEGDANPNNLVLTDRKYPNTCVGHEVNVTHPHVDAYSGQRVTAEAAGCAANWHQLPGSGHPLNGTAGTAPESECSLCKDCYSDLGFNADAECDAPSSAPSQTPSPAPSGGSSPK